ncbi:MAG: hypothetical protein R3B89_08990 [Polyangiaceae bacterium]
MDRAALDRLQRHELIELARSRGVERPEVMTRDELIDDMLRGSVSDPTEMKSVRGWFGVARDLLAGLVEQGLHLPDAAKVIRGDGTHGVPSGRRPLATVTLAEIYAAQGHLERGIAVLREVLDKEPEHEVARRLLSELEVREASQQEPQPEAATEWPETGSSAPVQPPERSAAEPLEAPAAHVESLPEAVTTDRAEVVLKPEPEPAAPTLRTTQLNESILEETETGEGQEQLEESPGDLESPDSCVLFAADKRVVVSWRIAESSFAKHLREEPQGAPVVRLVWWVPGLPASRFSLDVAATQASGELLVEPQTFGAHAVLRGALGWHDGASGEFAVMATALVLALGETADQPLFRPHAAAPGPGAERVEAAHVLAQRYV